MNTPGRLVSSWKILLPLCAFAFSAWKIPLQCAERDSAGAAAAEASAVFSFTRT